MRFLMRIEMISVQKRIRKSNCNYHRDRETSRFKIAPLLSLHHLDCIESLARVIMQL